MSPYRTASPVDIPKEENPPDEYDFVRLVNEQHGVRGGSIGWVEHVLGDMFLVRFQEIDLILRQEDIEVIKRVNPV